jgi:Protein of unknown function (DUF2510)
LDLLSLANYIQRAKLVGPSGDRGGVELVEGRQPGWYPDPDHPPTSERYWDGSAWTEQTRGTGQRQPAGPPQPAGWYPDPANVEVERYWDGAEWTERYRPQKKGRGKWIAVAAAVVIVAAIIIAVVATSGGSSNHTPPTSTTITPPTTARTPRTTTVTRPPRTTPTPTTTPSSATT